MLWKWPKLGLTLEAHGKAAEVLLSEASGPDAQVVLLPLL